MMNLKPWYKVVVPREDLREGKPLDASEFAVHLDQIRDKRAPDDYQSPDRFFERTYLTKGLKVLAVEVVRRLNGVKVETSAVFNMSTQFGGGKTHSLALLYHLATGGSKAKSWKWVSSIFEDAKVTDVPESAVAVFVGTEFDSISGRGGNDGTPLRKTPWGEIAFQLGGSTAFEFVKEHDNQLIAPSSEVIRKIFPKGKPVLILMDELMNYVNRFRRIGLGAQLYSFLQNLSEESRANDNVVLAVSIPASELEMSAEDEADYTRYKKVLDRLGKPVIMSSEGETSEIIRRRLFEWGGLPDEARKAASEYADWVLEHRQQIPNWFPADNARELFEATYPFHPMVISVFERKWQALPRFQRTRGVLRLLALWVSYAYQSGFKGALKDPVITLGSAPLEDPMFRTAVLEQLGEARLEGSITTDITGRTESHAVRLDKEAVDTIKKSFLHQRVAKSIFFESNGGQLRAEATLPEVRLAISDPNIDIGNVETVLDNLIQACYFLSVENNRFKFSLYPNLNKLLSDRRASIQGEQVKQLIRTEIQNVFASGSGVERVFFPERSNQIPDRPAVTFVMLSPEQSVKDEAKVYKLIEEMTQEYGKSARTFKSALIWIVADSDSGLYDDGRKMIAWEAIQEEQDELKLDDIQKRQLSESVKRAQRDLKESIWRAYKNIIVLDKNSKLKTIDLGLVHSSAAENLVTLVLNRLRQDGEIEKEISPNFIVRNWPPAFVEWSTKSLRDAFYASPIFPRLLNPESIRETIIRGVEAGIFAYVGKTQDTKYEPFNFEEAMLGTDIEISDDMYIVQKSVAEEYRKNQTIPAPFGQPRADVPSGGEAPPTHTPTRPCDPFDGEKGKENTFSLLRWVGDVTPQKWMNFYTKVLSRFVTSGDLKLKVEIEVISQEGISQQKVEQTKVALRELGLSDSSLETEK
jgi:hypothetical protein